MTIEINNIIKDEYPESNVEGHRVHTTMIGSGESWPEWSVIVFGVAKAFVHFEVEEDGRSWYEYQKTPKLAA